MKLSLGITAFLFAAGVASARPGAPRRPPPEAIDACQGHSAGDACSVKLRERTIDGICRAAPEGDTGPLACVPDGPPPGPPPEAIAACDGHAAGDACSVTFGDRTIGGVCRSGPDGDGPLACAPDRPPPR